MTLIRRPAVAGSFYPDDPAVLACVVEDFLAEAEDPVPGISPKALIVPHAGYIYSGPVAARAYAALRSAKGKIDRAVLLGPAHYVWVEGIAVPAAEAFETPLGRLPVDLAGVRAIVDLPQVVVADAPHGPEHCLEVQLPFLMSMLGPVSFVPLVVGQVSPEEVAAVIERLWGESETLIIVSSDLSHYLPYRAAQRCDAATAEAIEALDAARLGPEDACGYLPIAGLVAAATRHALAVARLDLRNSGDTGGARDRVVGYGAWAFYGTES